MSWAYLCYSFRTGAPVGCTIDFHTLFGVTESVANGIVSLDCQIEPDGSITPGTCANGGHRHSNATRPSIRNQASQQLNFPGDTNPAKLTVAGPMAANHWILVDYETPENGGFFYWQARIIPPPCYFLPQFCGFVGRGAQPDGSRIWDGTVEVSYRELRQLPSLPNSYVPFRSPDNSHVDAEAFAASDKTIQAMRLIGDVYFQDTGKILRPNDISLPLGGVFDVADNWGPSHFEHRRGNDIDINRAPADPANPGVFTAVDCERDIDFVEAVNKVLLPVRTEVLVDPGNPLPIVATAVRCETRGRKHIDVVSLVATQQTP